ncbi:hypothetical protein CXG81DRAFT_11355 [Caulochytrium protostelioides]|uniref:MIR domain-containing protein n=1 Tax=Caulochytrium protostelioides TaxID=1555241 RepID=A0A4V1ITR4_9FUNG|nr:hypothetical protein CAUPRSCDRAFT_5665 [Caulochytrium protostelioides]RKP01952.1 hypothetical protein CXG81DRAFT_11355 [Caulochytrium protostelioides]|eukprot:RKP01952.1 hypothetical protein CXG81DRAFT_11355 [Caulochytrium protostelioides]
MLLVAWLGVLCAVGVAAHDDFVIEPEFAKVTIGSSIKLTHLISDYKLHSHAVAYGSGSHQQSVTAFPEADSSDSYFLVSGIAKEISGDAIKCGSTVQLKHLSTKKWLHSHDHEAPLSTNREVSAYDGLDTGNHWIVHCRQKGASYWMREQPIALKHVDSGRFLSASKAHVFRDPISGHLEVSCIPDDRVEALWVAQEGIYLGDRSYADDAKTEKHDEL